MATAEQARQLLSLHGETQPQPPGDWSGTFLIPAAIEQFYRDVGPADIRIVGYGNPYFLPRLASLWTFQAGYRWNGLSGEPIEDWNDDWLVVADEGGDPFIFSRSSGVVLHAYHGEGIWDASEMFSDINMMAACLAQLGAVVLEAGSAFTEENCCIRPESRELALARLAMLLGSRTSAESVLGVLGWG
jgi:hypothetical protein